MFPCTLCLIRYVNYDIAKDFHLILLNLPGLIFEKFFYEKSRKARKLIKIHENEIEKIDFHEFL